jgi:hypothetical protein
MKIRLLFEAFLAVAILSTPTFAQTTGAPVSAQPKVQAVRPVLHLDVQTNVEGPDPISTTFLKPIIDGLNETFELRPNRATIGESGLEVRIFVLAEKDQYFITTVVLAKTKDENLRIYVSSTVLITNKETAEVDGQGIFAVITDNIKAFINEISKTHSAL